MKRHLTPFHDCASVPAWWKPLFLVSCNASIFLSEEWLQTWLDVYGREFQGLWVSWDEDQRIVGGCLLLTRTVRKRFVPLRSLYLNATGEASERTPLAEFNDILHVSGYEDAITRDFLDLLNAIEWDRLLLSGHQECGLLARLIPGLPAAEVECETRAAPYVDLAALSDATFETSLTANTRSQIRRSGRLYAEKLGELSITVASSREEALHFLEGLAQLHNARWQAKGESGSFAHAAVLNFHRQFISRAWSSRVADLIRVSAGATVIGYLYNFTHLGKVYFFQSGFVYDADARLKPGMLTHSMSIEHYRRQGSREYDFLAGDAQYKRALAKHSRSLSWTTVYRDRPWLRFILGLRRFKAWMAARRNAYSPA